MHRVQCCPAVGEGHAQPSRGGGRLVCMLCAFSLRAPALCLSHDVFSPVLLTSHGMLSLVLAPMFVAIVNANG